MKVKEEICDVLVLGSGLGGVRAAIEAERAGLNTLVVDKSILARASASIYAGSLVSRKPPEYLVKMGFIEPGMDFEEPFSESFRYFVKDGARTGGSEYTADQRVAMMVACEMESRAEELRDFGVKDIYSQRWLGPPGLWGKNIMLPLIRYIKKSGIKTREMTMITDFIPQDGEIVGAVGFDIRKKCFTIFRAKAVVMATGSHAQVYERVYAPIRTTGDGFAMAYRAGAALFDMEMMGFDNWGLAEPGLPQYWIPGSLARTQGVLKNAKGETFFLTYAQEKGITGKGATLSLNDNMSKRYGRPFIELVPHLIKACQIEIREGRGDDGAVYYDLSQVPEEHWRLDSKGIFALNLLRGFDLKKKPLKVAPICIGDFKGGGVKIDEKGKTNIPGLFAAGDVTPGSSMLYALTTGVRAGRSAAGHAMAHPLPQLHLETRDWIREKLEKMNEIRHRKPSENGKPEEIKGAVKKIMWRAGGPIRDEKTLKGGMGELEQLRERIISNLSADGSFRRLREAMEAVNMIQVSLMILPASLFRQESRGYCQRTDYPERDDVNWLKNTYITQGKKGVHIEAKLVDFVFLNHESISRRPAFDPPQN